MDNNMDDQFLIMKATIDSTRKYFHENINEQESKIDKLTAIFKKMMNQI